MTSHRFLAAFALLAVAAPSTAQTKYTYLHQTTNEILQIQRSTMKMTAADAVGIATRVCRTLEILRKDENFARDVNNLARASTDQASFHRQLADDLVFFLDAFATEESEALWKAGLSQNAALQMMAAASTLRAALRQPTKVDELWRNIDKLRGEVCSAAKTMDKAGEDERSKQHRWRLVRRWGLGLSGLSMIAVDGLSATLTAGVSTASFALGGAAVGAAIGQ